MRISIILVTCSLICSQLRAQNDTTPPPPSAAPAQVQDTTIHVITHSIRLLSHRDSVRRDSIRHVRRDSIARVRRDSSVARVRGDSVARLTPDTALKAAPDTLRRDSVKPAATAAPSTGPPELPEELHHPNSKDSLFYLIVAILFYFALIRIFYEKYFNNLLTLFFRVSLRQQQIREQVLQTPLPSLLLNILFVISGGLYACFLLHYSRWHRGKLLDTLPQLYGIAGRDLPGEICSPEIYRLGIFRLEGDGYLHFHCLFGEQNAGNFPSALLDCNHFFGPGMAGGFHNYFISNDICLMGLPDTGVLSTGKK